MRNIRSTSTFSLSIRHTVALSTLSLIGARRRGRYECDNHSHIQQDQEFHDKPIGQDSVEIGKPGSGIMVDYLQWTCASSRSTFTAMGISLLMAVFPIDVLLRSNLKGGTSKLQQGDAAVHHDALDSQIIDAIKGAVRSKHPNTYDDATMGIAINSKLCALRRAHSSKPLG